MLDTLPRWAALSVGVYVCAANLWALLRRERGALPGFWRVLFPVLQALFMLGPPYAALLSGRLSPALAALELPPGPRVLEVAAPMVLGAALLSGLLLWLHRQLLARRYPPGIFPAVRMRAQLSRPWAISYVLFDAFCYQAHWAFYRLGAGLYLHDLARGAVVGTLLVLLEWGLAPGWRARLWRPGLAEDQLLLLALLLFSAQLSLQLTSFWVLLATHTVLWLLWYTLLQRWYHSAAAAALDSGLP